MKTVEVKPKPSVGRPATGKDPLIGARFPPVAIAEIDAWATANATSRSDAIRRLVEMGLKQGEMRGRNELTPGAAKETILREWRTLPKLFQNSSFRRVGFAAQMTEKYLFKCSEDPYRLIMAWLRQESLS